MTALRDPFDVVHKKDIKNKSGAVVAQVDYVGWSQSADRLDDAAPEDWSFSIVNIGTDWVHGRLQIGERHYENIGYAENADMDWKKEPLKDAASDAFKRCAALAGVARYLYDKDARPSAPRQAAPPPSDDPMEPDDDEIAALHPQGPPTCSIHKVPYIGGPGDWWHKADDGSYCRHPGNVRKARAR